MASKTTEMFEESIGRKIESKEALRRQYMRLQAEMTKKIISLGTEIRELKDAEYKHKLRQEAWQ